MADYQIPDDLLQLKKDFNANDASLPQLEGEAWKEAYRRVQDLALEIHRHDWWASVDNRHSARMALQKAAQGGQRPAG